MTVHEAMVIVIALAKFWNNETIAAKDINVVRQALVVRETLVYEPMLAADINLDAAPAVAQESSSNPPPLPKEVSPNE